MAKIKGKTIEVGVGGADSRKEALKGARTEFGRCWTFQTAKRSKKHTEIWLVKGKRRKKCR